MQKWKWIKGYYLKYKISNTGNVCSFLRHKEGRRRKLNISKSGYYTIILNNNNLKKEYKVARLVARAFIPNPVNKLQVNHKNGNKLDNNVKNLEWCTPKENVQHAWDTGLSLPLNRQQNGMSKLTECQIEEIGLKKRIFPHLSTEKIGKMFNVSGRTIRYILKKEIKTVIS